MLRFDGRVAIVTGAGRGLGLAIAQHLASRGAAVVVNDLGVGVEGGDPDPTVAADAAAALRAAGASAESDAGDVADPAVAAELVALALRRFGRIDVVVNNAGTVVTGPFADLRTEVLWRTMAVHLGGHVNVTRAAWPHLIRQRYGRVVMTASSAALLGAPQLSAYAAAKGAVIGLARALAQEAEGSGVTVNAVVPGAHTRMAEHGMASLDPDHLALLRASMPAEKVAPVVAWLSHEACKANGQIVNARGGAVAAMFVGQTAGLVADDLSVELLVEREHEVFAVEGFHHPRTTAESAALALQRPPVRS